MSNLKNLKTNHYKSKTISHKKITLLKSNYIGFKINDLLNFKFYHKNPNIIEFNLKGFSFIKENNISESTLQNL